MRIYKRLQIPGGCYFFTVNLAERQDNDMLIRHIENLREAFRQIRNDHPFNIDAIVILPEHLHCIRDEQDYQNHLDYIHYNPVKHGYVQLVKDWPYSSFHRYAKSGMYPENWSASPEIIEYPWEWALW